MLLWVAICYSNSFPFLKSASKTAKKVRHRFYIAVLFTICSEILKSMESGDQKFKIPIIICVIGMGLDAIALVTFFVLMLYHLLFG